MEAGRELDALVAEKVMGYTIGNDPLFQGRGPKVVSGPHWITCDGDEPTWQRENGWPITCPKFSTEIAAAWEVVEKLAKDGNQWILHVGKTAGFEDNWAKVGSAADEALFTHFYRGDAEEIPHAICLAALKAKGVESE